MRLLRQTTHRLRAVVAVVATTKSAVTVAAMAVATVVVIAADAILPTKPSPNGSA